MAVSHLGVPREDKEDERSLFQVNMQATERGKAKGQGPTSVVLRKVDLLVYGNP